MHQMTTHRSDSGYSSNDRSEIPLWVSQPPQWEQYLKVQAIVYNKMRAE